MPFFIHIPASVPPGPEHLYGTTIVLRGDASVTIDTDTFSNVATGTTNYWGYWYKLNEALETELKGKITCTAGFAYPNDIVALDNGSFFVSGAYSDDVTVHPALGAPGSPLTATARYPGALTQGECFLAYYNALGTPQWILRFGGTATSDTRVFTMYLARSGNGVACFTQTFQFKSPFTPEAYQIEAQMGSDTPTVLGNWGAANFMYGQAITRVDTTGAITITKQITQNKTDFNGGFPRVNFMTAGRPSTRNGKIAIGYFNQQADSFNITFGSGEANERTFLWPNNSSSPSGVAHRAWNYLALFNAETLEVEWVAAGEHFDTSGINTFQAGGFLYGSAILSDGSVAFNMFNHALGNATPVPITRFYGDNLSAGLDTDSVDGLEGAVATHILLDSTGAPLWTKTQVGGQRRTFPYSVARAPDDTLIFMQEAGTSSTGVQTVSFDHGNITTTYSASSGTANAPLDIFIKRDSTGSIVGSAINQISDIAGITAEFGYSFHKVEAKSRNIWATGTWNREDTLTFAPGEAGEIILTPDPLGPAQWVATYDANLNFIAARRLTTLSGVPVGDNYLETYDIRLANK